MRCSSSSNGCTVSYSSGEKMDIKTPNRNFYSIKVSLKRIKLSSLFFFFLSKMRMGWVIEYKLRIQILSKVLWYTFQYCA